MTPLLEDYEIESATGSSRLSSFLTTAACGLLMMPHAKSAEWNFEMTFHDVDSATADCSLPKPVADSTVAIEELPPIQSVERLLVAPGYIPTGSCMTEDGSKLFEFIGEKKVGVDVDPSGEVLVMVRREGGTDYYELNAARPAGILKVLKNVGVSR